MGDYTREYDFKTPQETLDFLRVAKYFRYHPDDGLEVGRVADEWRALRLSPVQLLEIDVRLVSVLDYYFHNSLKIAPLLKETLRMWGLEAPSTPFPAALDVTDLPDLKIRPNPPPSLWNSDVQSVIFRERAGKQLIVVRAIDVVTTKGIPIVVRAEARLLPRTEEAFEALRPGSGARYQSALEMCAALNLRIEDMRAHIFPVDLPSCELPDFLASNDIA